MSRTKTNVHGAGSYSPAKLSMPSPDSARLVQDSGLDTLIETGEHHLVSFKDDQVRELFHAGTESTGV